MEKIIKKTVYSVQAYEIIKNQIFTGQLASGEKINENLLAHELGVSRSPIREALRMLEQDKLIISTDNGLKVNPLDAEDVRNIYECRKLLESYAAHSSVKFLTDADLDVLRGYVEQALAYNKAGDWAKVTEVNTEFHDMITGACPNPYLQSMIEQSRALFRLARSKEFFVYKRNDTYLYEHLDIIDALRERDGAKVETLMRMHIQGDMEFHLANIKS